MIKSIKNNNLTVPFCWDMIVFKIDDSTSTPSQEYYCPLKWDLLLIHLLGPKWPSRCSLRSNESFSVRIRKKIPHVIKTFFVIFVDRLFVKECKMCKNFVKSTWVGSTYICWTGLWKDYIILVKCTSFESFFYCH